MPRILIRTLDDARLIAYRDLKQRTVLRRSGLFIAEGPRVVRRLVESDFEVESVLVSQRRRQAIVPRIGANVPVYVIPQAAAEALLGYNFHAGVLACGRLRPTPSLEEFLE